ncbi:hypothetical protein [Geoalkalibacter sp.]|uniref:hypothetical protein n=1 Tax=Geoalkalibacter sp. TaxID=3041440 RepID=UPI00272E8908|nr:hypothetical protein [Geoalkalibacter sp.]
MIPGQLRTWLAVAGVASVLAVAVAFKVQASRLELTRSERNVAVQMYEHTADQLAAAHEHRRQRERAEAQRQRELLAAKQRETGLRNELQRISKEHADEEWQACRTVATPDALIARLLATD